MLEDFTERNKSSRNLQRAALESSRTDVRMRVQPPPELTQCWGRLLFPSSGVGRTSDPWGVGQAPQRSVA